MTKEVIQIVEILQPFCGNVFGSAPCTATGTAATKCYKTFATCQDEVNYTAGTKSLFFSRGNVADRDIDGAGYIMPLLVRADTLPTKINLAAASNTAEALGNRGSMKVIFRDAPGTDAIVDPHADERPWDTLKDDRGSYWTRWMMRNKYKQNVQINVYEGYLGQSLSEMSKSTYFIESAVGPDSGGKVTLTCYDPLHKVNARESQFPKASPGVLFQGISAGATTMTVAAAVEADYPTTGTLRIDDEVMTYTGRTFNGKNLVVTGLSRGTDKSTAAAHSFDAKVQECQRFTDDTVDDVVARILEYDGQFAAAQLDKAGWATEVDTYLALYRITNLITEPTAKNDLLSQLQEQLQFYIWWHDRDAVVKLKTLRGLDATPVTLSDTDSILAGNYSSKDLPRQRSSQIWVYHSPTDYTSSRTDPDIYTLKIWANLGSEGENAHGSASIRRIYGNWLSSTFMTRKLGRKVLHKYVDIPREVTIRCDAKDRILWTGDVLKLDHFRERDIHGARAVRTWLIISAKKIRPDEVVEYVLQEITQYGVLNFIMASGAADYVPGGPNPEKNGFIGNASGVLSDGTDCARISV